MSKEELAKKIKLRFRLLNSEIGNDQLAIENGEFRSFCFRLLNSEIGNDQERK